jgi:hypothetical protein
MSKAPFPITPELTAIAIAYRNPSLIADQVLPYVPVGKKEFKYWKYEKPERFTLPDNYVGRKSSPNQVEFNATEETDSVVDFGLDDIVPNDDIDNAPPNYNPLGNAVEGIQDLNLLAREKRVADLVFNTASYNSGNRTALSASADKWSTFDTSDPIEDVLTALDTCIMRPNVMVLGNSVWTVLRRHPKVIKATNKNSGDSGVAARAAVAELLELEEILVGQGWLNTSKKGQTASFSRVWGNYCALIYRNRQANTQRGTTYGFTARFGTPVAGSLPEPTVGLRGSIRVRAGESVKELILADDLGYLFSAVIA